MRDVSGLEVCCNVFRRPYLSLYLYIHLSLPPCHRAKGFQQLLQIANRGIPETLRPER